MFAQFIGRYLVALRVLGIVVPDLSVAVKAEDNCVLQTVVVGGALREDVVNFDLHTLVFEAQTAAATTEYKGETYHFCAKGCKVAFDKNPEKYVETKTQCGGCHC